MDQLIKAALLWLMILPLYAGHASLSWEAPTTDTNGDPLTGISGYNIYYGTESGNYTETINVPDGAATTYSVDGLYNGEFFFVATAYNSDGESSYSVEASKVITEVMPLPDAPDVFYEWVDEVVTVGVSVVGAGVLVQSSIDGSIPVTIPPDAEMTIVFFSGFNGLHSTAAPFAKLSWDNGASVDFAEVARAYWNGTTSVQLQALYMLDTDLGWPGSGLRTLHYASAMAYSEGFNVYVLHVKGVDRTNPIDQVETQQGSGAPVVWTSTLIGDFIMGAGWGFNMTPSFASPAISLVESPVHNQAGITVGYGSSITIQGAADNSAYLAFSLNSR